MWYLNVICIENELQNEMGRPVRKLLQYSKQKTMSVKHVVVMEMLRKARILFEDWRLGLILKDDTREAEIFHEIQLLEMVKSRSSPWPCGWDWEFGLCCYLLMAFIIGIVSPAQSPKIMFSQPICLPSCFTGHWSLPWSHLKRHLLWR